MSLRLYSHIHFQWLKHQNQGCSLIFSWNRELRKLFQDFGNCLADHIGIQVSVVLGSRQDDRIMKKNKMGLNPLFKVHGSHRKCSHSVKCKLFFWGLLCQRDIPSGIFRLTLKGWVEIFLPKKGGRTPGSENNKAVTQVGKTKACPETGAAATLLGAEKGRWMKTLVMQSFALSAAVLSAMPFLGFLQSHSALSLD